MKWILGLALMVMIATPAPIEAQSPPGPGTRLRISQIDGSIVTGTVQSWGPDGVAMVVDDGEAPMLVPLGTIEFVQTRKGKRSFARGFGVTLAVSAVDLGAVSALAWSPCTETGFMACFLHPESRGQAFGWGAMAGAVVGVPLGAIVGLAGRGEYWSDGQRMEQTVPTPTIRPVFGRSVGFTASIPVGGR